MLRGTHSFTGRDTRRIEEFFVQSAKDFGEALPERPTLVAGEILCKDLEITAARLFGQCDFASGNDGTVITGNWNTTTLPQKISFGENYEVNPDDFDKNEDYVAAYKYNDELILIWNVAQKTFDKLWNKTPATAMGVFFEVQDCELSDKVSFPEQRKYLNEIERHFESPADDAFENLIVHSKSGENSDFYNISKSDEFGVLSYMSLRRMIDRQLEQVISAFVDVSRKAIKRTMEEYDLDEESAKILLEETKSIYIEKLPRTGWFPITKVEKILENALIDVRREAATLSAFDFVDEEKELNAFIRSIKRDLAGELKSAVDGRFCINNGRPKGTKKFETKEDKQAVCKMQFDKIVDAIKSVYSKSLNERKDHGCAETAVKMDAVLESLGVWRPTLNGWLKSSCDLEELSELTSAFENNEEIPPKEIFEFIKEETLIVIRGRKSFSK